MLPSSSSPPQHHHFISSVTSKWNQMGKIRKIRTLFMSILKYFFSLCFSAHNYFFCLLKIATISVKWEEGNSIALFWKFNLQNRSWFQWISINGSEVVVSIINIIRHCLEMRVGNKMRNILTCSFIFCHSLVSRRCSCCYFRARSIEMRQRDYDDDIFPLCQLFCDDNENLFSSHVGAVEIFHHFSLPHHPSHVAAMLIVVALCTVKNELNDSLKK